jgi:integrase
MSSLSGSLTDYLLVRRALGYKLRDAEHLLGGFIAYLQEQEQETITIRHALAWATLPARSDTWHALRFSVVRGFASYLHSIDPAHEVPPSELLPRRSSRATPYLYSAEQIAALLDRAGTLKNAHRAATYTTLIGLLAVTGMRVGETLGLDREDFDDTRGTLLIRNAKFGKSRVLPLHESTVVVLARYLRRADRPPPAVMTPALFLSTPGTRVHITGVWHTFHQLTRLAQIEARSASCRPRLHDLRHSFAVQRMLDAYRSGEEAGPRLALLSTYLGHVNPANTYWYLSASPELMQLAADRLECHLGGQR